MTFDALFEQYKKVRNLDVVGPHVGCSIKAMLIISKTEIAFLFAEGHCCDMTRMISFSKFILNDVTTILTFSGNNLDTCYFKKNGKWEAISKY